MSYLIGFICGFIAGYIAAVVSLLIRPSPSDTDSLPAVLADCAEYLSLEYSPLRVEAWIDFLNDELTSDRSIDA